jgi:hypothetical protein
MKNVRAFVIVSALLLVLGSVSSALAFPQPTLQLPVAVFELPR